MDLGPDDAFAAAAAAAVRDGDAGAVAVLLADNPGLAAAYLQHPSRREEAGTLLHVATDWPGHVPNVAAVIRALVAAGANVDARFRGFHRETPLHWAASSDDVDAVDALLDAGADIEADGAVAGGGSPLADACAFAQWNAARRLVERGARTTLSQAAALGLVERVEASLGGERPSREEIDRALWSACRGGSLECARLLAAAGADLDWIPPWEEVTPLDAAVRSGATGVARWLRERGARTAAVRRSERDARTAAATRSERGPPDTPAR